MDDMNPADRVKKVNTIALRYRVTVLGLIFLAAILASQAATAARIKDLTAIEGVRTNQLVGYGLVVGLAGTGDGTTTNFTVQSLLNMLERMGVHVSSTSVKVKNVAAVMVTASMPPFARIGNQIDVLVSSVGDAKSLVGGTLLMTPLRGVNGKVYALAQGAVSVGGVGASGGGGTVTKNHLLAARVADGATVEREVPMTLNGKKWLTMTLFNPDFNTAIRVSKAINASTGMPVARALDSGTLRLDIPQAQQNNVAGFLAQIDTLEVVPDSVARIVVNEKTGTVVVGENVRISPVAIAHGNLSITVQESANVSQPGAFSGGTTVTTPQSKIQIKEESKNLLLIEPGSTIRDLAKALNAVGATPRDLISIFQSIKAAGALQAELEII
jgi:flagellar P-ring protein FlgI